jgi:DNA-binding NarL/FixJ family response regulator
MTWPAPSDHPFSLSSSTPPLSPGERHMTTDRAITKRSLRNGNAGELPSFAKTRVAIVEDHSMVADVLARIISNEDDFYLVGVAATIAGAIVLVEVEVPDVVLMDVHLPDGDGVDATKEILKRWPKTKILMLSGSGGRGVAARAIKAGCSGFLAKTRPAAEIVAAVWAVARGEMVFGSDDRAETLRSSEMAPTTTV